MRRPYDVACEREKVVESERERVFEFWKEGMDEGGRWLWEFIEEKTFHGREAKPKNIKKGEW